MKDMSYMLSSLVVQSWSSEIDGVLLGSYSMRWYLMFRLRNWFPEWKNDYS